MASLKRSNDKVIDRAFTRLVKSEDSIVRDGMYALLCAGLEYLHEAHDPDLHHENESDTLGWALIHDGAVLEAVSQSMGPWTPHGDALGKLMSIVSEMPSTGWSGVVLSDMANDWYRVDWEMDFLTSSAEQVKANFRNFFKPVTK